MSHFFEGHSKNCCLLAIQEQGAEFGFGGRSYDETQDSAKSKKCAVELYGLRCVGFPTHEEVAASAAVCIFLGEVRCVRMYV